MNAKGRAIVLVIFGAALAMAVGGWWYQYEASRRAAAFWGADGARLISSDSTVKFFVVEDGDEADDDRGIAGRPIAKQFDLTDERGLVHLRHALTQDADFEWEGLAREAEPAGPEWRYAMRFAVEDDRLDVLFTENFDRLGKVDDGRGQIDALPCPRMAPAIERYLSDVGAPIGKTEPAADR